MTILFWGLILFAAAFLLHLVIWKIRLPKRQTKAFLGIFSGVLIAGLIILAVYPSSFNFLGIPAPDNFLEYLHISLVVVSLTLAYMITYTAIEAESPSLLMILNIAQAGPNGLNRDDFYNSLTDDILVKPRIRDLVLDKMAYLEGDRYRLTSKGIIFAKIFIFQRALLNAPKGG